MTLGGTGKWQAIKTYLERGNIKKVIISTDNDDGGITVAQLICSYIRENYNQIDRKWKLPPKDCGKDWNKVLQNIKLVGGKR